MPEAVLRVVDQTALGADERLVEELRVGFFEQGGGAFFFDLAEHLLLPTLITIGCEINLGYALGRVPKKLGNLNRPKIGR
jgi:hypothetical protein